MASVKIDRNEPVIMRRTARCLLIVVASSVLLIASGGSRSDGIANVSASTPHTTATYHAKNGLIAFTRYRRQDDPIWSEIFVASADGSGARRVSHSSEAVEDDQAHWSPDGAWIVFARCRPAPEVCSIWLVRPDGSGQRQISPACAPHAVPPACADDSNPSFAPDGRHIVFQHEHGHVRSDPLGESIEHSDIVETDLAGAHATVLVQLTGYRGDVMGPRLSPDGKQLVFERYNSSRARPKGGLALFIMNVDGGALRLLTPWSLKASGADWSPDGSRILFRPGQAGGELTPGSNLFTIRPDGTGLRQVTHVPAGSYVTSGSYSPDGTSIVFATNLRATPNDRGGTAADVFAMRVDTHQLRPVTRTPNLDGWPAWGSHSAG